MKTSAPSSCPRSNSEHSQVNQASGMMMMPTKPVPGRDMKDYWRSEGPPPSDSPDNKLLQLLDSKRTTHAIYTRIPHIQSHTRIYIYICINDTRRCTRRIRVDVSQEIEDA